MCGNPNEVVIPTWSGPDRIAITVFIRYHVRPMSIQPKMKRAETRLPPDRRRRDAAAALRRTIRGIEEAAAPERPRLSLGVPRIDRVLPGGGLRLGCVHEVAGDEAATGFCATLLARALATGRGSLLWLARGDDLYAPGLVRYGIGAGQLLVVSGLRRSDDMLWAMEEALRCRAVTGVVAEMGGVVETGGIGLAAGRRLMLAAEGTGVLGLVLSRRAGERRGGGAGVRGAVSRWRVTAVPGGHGNGGGTETRWRIELLHCRGGRPAEWTVSPRARP